MGKQQDQDYIAGLLIERAGAVQTGKKDHLSQIDAELKRVGYSKGDKIESESAAWAERETLETATLQSVRERATTNRRGKAKPKAPRAATPTEEKAIAATVKAEEAAPVRGATSSTFSPPTPSTPAPAEKAK